MKEKYLEELRELLSEYKIGQDEIEDIMADYAEMIDDALAKKLDEEKIIKLIGSPKEVVRSLSDEFEEKGEDYIYIQHSSKQKHKDNRIVALMPFISLIAFFALGFGFGLWHPGWLVFLSIPMTAIIVNAFDRNSMNGIIALSPFVALIAFLILGFGYNLWHPGWLVFMVIPMLGICSALKTMKFISFLTAQSPFVATITFVLVGYYTGLWNPIWLVFMIIPMLGILHETKVWKIIVSELGFLIAIAAYLFAGYQFGEWGYGLFAFLLPVGLSLLLSEDPVVIVSGGSLFEWLFLLGLTIIFVASGILFNNWAYMWQVFLLLPVAAILRHTGKKDKLVACMPFISTIIFFSLGYFFEFWAFSWMAFLLIPMVAIIQHAK